MTTNVNQRESSVDVSDFAAGGDDLPASVDRGAVRRMQFVARMLDDAVRVPGTNYRVGLDPILGLLPVSGDLVAGVLSLYIVVEAARQGVPAGTLVRMLGNVAIDVGAGSIPILGDLFDASWKANRRNVRLALSDLVTTPAEATEEPAETAEIQVD